ncbi:MAG: ferrous iron transporter B [Firmicutes bacterium]|nr:ferrous iron transporter B [Bacillota bacterium]
MSRVRGAGPNTGMVTRESRSHPRSTQEQKLATSGTSETSETCDIRDHIVSSIYRRAEAIARRVVQRADNTSPWDQRLDDILTSRLWGYPVMLLLLGIVFWITLSGANYPSQALASLLFGIEARLSGLCMRLGAPDWLHGFLIFGVYRAVAWVVSVMLPPMAIFFPCFTLLEDLGYLPRVAFNLDSLFKRAGTHGKQALTMSMGFGCNAAGVIACRIIDSPRERLIAILTNNFVPCNGRFPLLITLATIFMGRMGETTASAVEPVDSGVQAACGSTAAAAAVVVGLVLVGIVITLLVSWFLSRTILRGVPSSFTLELPPYRKPQVGRILLRSLIDRTAFVLQRAVTVAAPAGGITWVLANTYIQGQSIIAHTAALIEPFGRALGLDGFIIMAFILGLPANEIVLPILLMSYLSAGKMLEVESLEALRALLVEGHGWTWLTALSMMLFSLLHFPCGTTLWTIRKETGSTKWALAAAALPLAVASGVCFSITWATRLFGLP